MNQSAENMQSAQVVLRPASGRRLEGARITAETLAEYAPSPDAAGRAMQAFAAAGFQTGPMVGNSFSITAPASTFERMFGVRPPVAELNLPHDRLPPSIANDVEAVVFVPPPDFGPTRP